MALRLEQDALSGSGVCAITGDSNGPFVATDYSIDPRNLLNGNIFVKASFVLEMAEVAGAVRPETHAVALGELAEAHARIAQLESDVAHLQGENDALVVLVGGKLGARANHIRKEAGFKARQAFDKTRDFVNDAEEGETEADIAAAYDELVAA